MHSHFPAEDGKPTKKAKKEEQQEQPAAKPAAGGDEEGGPTPAGGEWSKQQGEELVRLVEHDEERKKVSLVVFGALAGWSTGAARGEGAAGGSCEPHGGVGAQRAAWYTTVLQRVPPWSVLTKPPPPCSPCVAVWQAQAAVEAHRGALWPEEQGGNEAARQPHLVVALLLLLLLLLLCIAALPVLPRQ